MPWSVRFIVCKKNFPTKITNRCGLSPLSYNVFLALCPQRLPLRGVNVSVSIACSALPGIVSQQRYAPSRPHFTLLPSVQRPAAAFPVSSIVPHPHRQHPTSRCMSVPFFILSSAVPIGSATTPYRTTSFVCSVAGSC